MDKRDALAFGIGVVAGLRSMTAPAAVSRAANDGLLELDDTPFAFMGSRRAAALTTAAALGEYVGDLLPGTPNRTDPKLLVGRILSGGLCGACLHAARKDSPVVGAVLGALGAVAGTFGGYEARKCLVNGLKVPDAVIAIPEDVFAIALGAKITHS